MTYDLVSLSIIMMIAVACPIITQLIPGKLMPQTVLLLVFGAIFGPFILDKIWVTKAVELLSELGLAFLFQLDVVLGAFAAGFILRFVTPNGNHTLNLKLEGVGYGFLIPVFFVVSDASIDVKAVVANPALLITFIIMLLLVRAVPFFVATTLDHRVNPLDPQDKLTVSLYCTTALPLIVAVTSLAVQGGTMHQTTASTLVAAGAVTVFLMPLLGGLTSKLMKGETRLIAPTA
ncbi:cation:proton antiporter domain-containing protein [Bifidobacterium breve]|uniref:cation:proton antiporter domain-containing protein n=1 Tax=Bifidobacterium breve TaxID=1685 RepID=UPI0007932039|nr:cation:proton antiporter [Bifidobacterium breve]KXS24214.1 MAG: transporter [Bifidobacterium breve]MCZ4475740.1 cation:proton antiporter [Bifidobacterium breve]MCZ4479937.1 cation:proton antiporter [Bifidobacterium breve]MCZ4487188.1 cation:proton antiporter [Bifidobacterium breve]MDK7091890.1 cation:proton antiporter [Bifidobacterium breve]